MKTLADRSSLVSLLVVALLSAHGASAQAPTPIPAYSGACIVNGSCSIKSSIQCTQAITTARLGGGNGSYVGDGTSCTWDCRLTAYAANQSMAFAFSTPNPNYDRSAGSPMTVPLALTLTSWSLKNASGAAVLSGSTAQPLTYPVVSGGGGPGLPVISSIPQGAFVVGPNAALANFQSFTVTAQGKDQYGRPCAAAPSAFATPPGGAVAPSNLAANAGTLSWTAPDAARYLVRSYTVRSATASGGPFSTVVGSGITATSFKLPSSVIGVVYLVVSSVNEVGEGPATAPVGVTITPAAPAAPTGVTAHGGSGEISISWQPVAGATSYSVMTSKTHGGPYTSALSNLTTNSGTISNLQAGVAVTYYLVVRATNSGGSSPNSAEVTATTLKYMQ